MINASFKSKSIIADAGTAAQITEDAQGNVVVDGLNPIVAANFKGYDETAPVAEVSQVKTVTFTAVAASTVYSIRLGDPNRVDQGFARGLTQVGVTTPADLTGYTQTTLVDALVKKINRLNLGVVASNVADALVLTDAVDYEPVGPAANRELSSVYAVSGVASIADTTAGVISFGQGEKLALLSQRSEATSDNLTAAAIYGLPTGFVAGTDYSLLTLKEDVALGLDAKTSGAQLGRKTQFIWAAAADVAAIKAALDAL